MTPDYAGDEFVNAIDKLARRSTKLSKMVALKTATDLPDNSDSRYVTSALLYCLTCAAMGIIPVLAMALMDGDNMEEKAKLPFPGNLDRDDILLACLFVAMTETITKDGRKIFHIGRLVNDKEEAEAIINREVDHSHALVLNAFEKLRGYRYVGSIIPKMRRTKP